MIKLLTLKHWQLFVMLVGIPFVFQFIVMGSVLAGPNPTLLITAFPIMMIYLVSLFFGWLYTIGTNLHKRLPSSAPMNLTVFKILLFVPVIYMLSLSLFMFSMFSTADGQPNPLIFVIILPLHLFSIFCIFYCLYFNAKALKSVELQRPVTFSDFTSEFFLMWFFPIGIWIIQPRLNKLFDPNAIDGNSQQSEHSAPIP